MRPVGLKNLTGLFETMRKISLLILLFVFSALACSVIAPTQVNLPQTEDDVPRVSVEEAKAAFDSGEAVLVDVRDMKFFALSHIAGAKNIPLANIERNPAGLSLNKNKWIIPYCT